MDTLIPPHKAALHRAAEELGGQAGIAKVLGYKDRRNVAPWFSTDRYLLVEHCVTLERATAGRVRRWDLRPNDWHRIWPELVGTYGAPAVKEAA